MRLTCIHIFKKSPRVFGDLKTSSGEEKKRENSCKMHVPLVHTHLKIVSSSFFSDEKKVLRVLKMYPKKKRSGYMDGSRYRIHKTR